MKKLILLLIIFLSLLTGCNPPKTSDKIVVYTTFYPMYDFTRKIGQEHIEVKSIIPITGESHDFEPSMSDLVALSNADVLIYNGLRMEPWLEEVLNSIQNEDLLLVDTSTNVTPIEGDPHIWLSLKNAQRQLLSITRALQEIDDENRDVYQTNYEQYVAEFQSLDQRYVDTLGSLNKKDIVVTHDAFGYLEHEYGLIQHGLQGIFSEGEPSPSKMAEMVDFIKQNALSTVFYESLESKQIAQTIANEAKVVAMPLYTIEFITQEQSETGADYLSLMEANLIALEGALS